MAKLGFLYKLLVGICSVAAISANPATPAPPAHWSYAERVHWKEHFSACGGEHQSPINLEYASSIAADYPSLMFNNYDQVLPEMLTNNGHTVMMTVNSQFNEEVPFLTGGGLTDTYRFFQLHFHWGKDSQSGSEHTINGRAYPAELHIVHYNTKYGNFSTAVAHPDGLAVLGIMIELQGRDNIAFRHLERFDEILNPDSDKKSALTYSVPLSDLLPDKTGTFFRYMGSLTTPGCNEDVTWTVFDTPIAISERQLEIFRLLIDSEGQQLEDNFRPVQELHDRVVHYRTEASY
ncbi:putative carbonic anhydrase 3 [Daphnia carinata]|uniref:putative carbonic anhydrase 3 n=1 Tax=Daphnia carinata TaxID=120202 RepID=UPI00257DFE38|nr:putative carbonic anhydrase 3 [Daphnia carinata]